MRKLGAVVAAVGLTVAVAAPAQALFVRPSTAPLLNAAGEDSGCDLMTRGSTFVRDDVRRLKHTAEVVCDTEWMRHRVVFNAFVVQDGERVPLYFGGGSVGTGTFTTLGGSSIGPVCQQDAWGSPWDPQPGVTYQIILQTRATVKSTRESSGEPWTARTEKLVEVSC